MRHTPAGNMVYQQQICDSYFVETHTDREKRFREEMREHERFAKKQTQLDIAEELSQLASQEYREDVLKHMELMEVRLAMCAIERPLLILV